MKRYILWLLIATATACGLHSCETEPVPTPAPTKPAEPEEKPDKPDNPDDKPDKPDTPDDKPDAPEEIVIYYDNLDKDIASSNNWFNTWTGFRNMEGTGIETVSYGGANTSVRNTFSSTGYPGASGMNGVYYSRGNAYIEVKGISLPSDKRTFKLTFGLCAYQKAVVAGKNFQVMLSDEHGEKNCELEYTVQSYGNWYLASSTFNIVSESTTKLNIKIIALTDGNQGRTDDLKLVSTTESTQLEYDFGLEKKDYIERPATLKANADYKYIDHRGTTYKTKQNVRNYEACYDTRRHNPMWVAYPCHEIWWEGGYNRPKKDPWRPDPEMTESEQSIIYASDWANWPWSASNGTPTDKYWYWSPMPSGKTVIKGHLMRSAERGCGDSSNPIDLNVQTFYPTNIAPECYQNATSTTSHWDMVEEILPNSWRCSDTLYVVVGCVYDDESWTLNDACNWGTTSAKSKSCTMPTARYKLVLRTKKGNTGKAVWECKADELMAIGFWFPQNFTGEKLTALPPLSDYIYSVSDIEKKIGGEFSFFPLAPQEVKESYSISDWPGLAAIAN